jgi:glutamate synthase (NADPH/NADH) small chain
VLTKEFVGEGGALTGLRCVKVDGKMQEIPDSSFVIRTDLVLLAMGFVSPLKQGLLEQIGLDLDSRGNVAADTRAYKSTREKVYACGDMRRGQSLVVWAIREGRQCAHAVDLHLMGETNLPR